MSDVIHPVGPVEVVVVGFADNRFDGSIATAIADLVARGIVRILDAVMVVKDDAGEVSVVEITDLDGDGVNDLALFQGDIPGLLSETDAGAAVEAMPPGSTVVMLAWENTWLAGAVTAMRERGGVVLAQERIPAADVDAVLTALEELDATG